MRRSFFLPVLLLGCSLPLGLTPPRALAAEKLTAPALIEQAKKELGSAGFRENALATLGEQRVKNGTAVIGLGPDFLWAVESATEPRLYVDDKVRPPMKRSEGSDLWVATGTLKPGISHSYYYQIGGRRFGGDFNVSAYLPESYEQPGIPKGKLSEKITHKSTIYDGMVSDYWIYVPAQYDAARPACVMVWNDGGGHVDRNGGSRTQNVIDNLIAQKRMPVTICVFINPGDISGSSGTKTFEYVTAFSKKTGRTMRDSMRSTEYDTVTDRYARFLVEEILTEVGRTYNLRKDGYSRAIVGDSSGGVAAFNAAWQRPGEFSRVLSRIGTYTSIQWIPGELDGGNIFPFAVRKTPRKNIRVWMSDGSEDLENEHGSWPMQNIQLANSLKMAGYDYHFSFSTGSHSGAHGQAEAPLAITWLWRDYDPSKTEQVYQQEESEKAKPYFRVKIINRD